jgi:uncharacterized protein
MKGCIRKRIFCLKLVVFSLLFMSCATMADFDFSAIDSSIRRSDYAAVYTDLQAGSSKLYSKNDLVLEDLDKGLISHYAGESDRSNKELSDAEQKIRDYYSKSVTQTITSFVVNDTVKDYSGETYEDIYTNIFKGLNYLSLGQFDEAFVEIRRFDNKLKEITSQYQGQLANEKRQLSSGAESVPAVNLKFHNSALARYISMLMYRSEGNPDDARIDYNQLKDAFVLQSELYHFDVPHSIDGDIEIPRGMARLNIISFTGLAPVKVENTVRVTTAGTYYKLALPEMKKRGSRIAYAEVTALSKTDDSASTQRMEKIESIEDIALDTYQQHYALIFTKTLARSIAKAATTAVLNDRSQNEQGSAAGLFSLLSLASALTTEVTERADVRTSRYFPAAASVAGMNLVPGTYDISVKYYDDHGTVVAERKFPDRAISSQALNLVESVCLR